LTLPRNFVPGVVHRLKATHSPPLNQRLLLVLQLLNTNKHTPPRATPHTNPRTAARCRTAAHAAVLPNCRTLPHCRTLLHTAARTVILCCTVARCRVHCHTLESNYIGRIHMDYKHIRSIRLSLLDIHL